MGLNAYSNCSSLTTGCFLYTDSGLTTPVANGVYSDGINTYTVTGGLGQITTQGSCPVATTTTTTTTTTTAAPTTTTTTTTTTEAPTTTTTTTTTTEAPTTTTTTTTTTEAPTTTTTTTTTTAAPTTTTTTTTTTVVPITCTQWQNLSGVSAYYDWTDCNGTTHSNEEILNNSTICAQDGTVSFISGGTLTSISNCTPATLNLAYSTVNGATACSTYPTTNTYYALTGSSLSNNTIIYTDFALTTLAPNGYYSDGVNYCDISGGTGTLQNQTSC